jgi:hypothetical protein
MRVLAALQIGSGHRRPDSRGSLTIDGHTVESVGLTTRFRSCHPWRIGCSWRARMKRLLLLLAACGSSESSPTPPTSGTVHHYVTTDLRVPITAELQREYGLDIDNDSAHKPDNQLGSVFVALSSSSDADIQGRIDTAIADGKLVLHHAVLADALASDGSVSWQVDVPDADGEPVIGKTKGNMFSATRAGAGRLTVQIQVSETDAPLALDLLSARVEAHVDDATVSGRLGGAVTQEDVDTKLIPSVVRMMNSAIARDPGCPSACKAGSSAALVIEVFDKNMDGTITEDEIRTSSIIQTLLAPDLDLDGDGERESISLGVGFEGVAL